MTSSVIGMANDERVEIPKAVRVQSLDIVGGTGTGKSALIENLVIQDIIQNIGVCVIDIKRTSICRVGTQRGTLLPCSECPPPNAACDFHRTALSSIMVYFRPRT